MFCSKTNYIKIKQTQKASSQIFYNEPHMPLEELLIHDQGISVHGKHIITSLIGIYKTFLGKNPYFMKSIFTKKDSMYNLRTSNLLTLPNINTRWFDLYSFNFLHFWNQLLDHIKYKTSVKVLKNKLVVNWQEISCSCAICRY